MSQRLISRSPDLKRLRDEGFGVSIRSQKYLLIHPVPYVNSSNQVAVGTLVCELAFDGNDVAAPADHVAHFIGDYPCDAAGAPLAKIHNSNTHRALAKDVEIDHTFSAKPHRPYADFYDKVCTYIAIITAPAQAIDPGVTAQTFPVFESSEEESMFWYVDTASSRAEIDAVTANLERGKLAIVGLGGTGSYVLDLVAKTPVKEIHLFDGDVFSQHNAFRSPGAPSIEELKAKPSKVTYWAAQYSRMHRRILPHPYYIDNSNLPEFDDIDFVFLCLDNGPAKLLLVERLEETGKMFVDVGMGLEVSNGAVWGQARVTASIPQKRDHLRTRVSFAGDGAANDYARNIQIADLNALNAALAVIKWKKLWGFYPDLEHEHFSAYQVDGNHIINDDKT